MVVRIRAPSTLVTGIYSTNASTTATTHGTSPLGSRRFTTAANVDVGYEQPQSVRPGRKLGYGKLVDRRRRVDDPEFSDRVHGNLQRPFGHYFLVRVERLDQLGYRKPTVDRGQKTCHGQSFIIIIYYII